jgi:hypothetical protein
VPRVVPTDRDDDHVIAAAVTAQADLIASGDKRDLLPLGSFQGIPIVTARDAVERLEARSKKQEARLDPEASRALRSSAGAERDQGRRAVAHGHRCP